MKSKQCPAPHSEADLKSSGVESKMAPAPPETGLTPLKSDEKRRESEKAAEELISKLVKVGTVQNLH